MAQPVLQIVATGKLNRVRRAQRIGVQQKTRAGRDRRHHFHDEQRFEISMQRCETDVALLQVAVAGPRPACER